MHSVFSPILRFRSLIVIGTVLLVGSGTKALSQEASLVQTRSFIAADSSRKTISRIDETGNTVWTAPIGPLHDLHVLESGNVLFQDSWTHILEVDPKTGHTVWEYEARKATGKTADEPLEIHAFQRLADGRTMVAESGRSRLIELGSGNSVVAEIPLRVSKPDAHRDTRLVRNLVSGNYLVCHEGDGLVREYGPSGETVWEYRVPLFDRKRAPGHGVDAFGNQCFSALRLNSGNTLIGTGNGHSVLEVNPNGEIVWSLHQNDLPGIQLAWVTSLQVFDDGNIMINNCHAGPSNPQLIEVTRDRQVVWTFRDFDRFGDSLTNSQILTRNGHPVQNSIR
jgi:outer membrane protein assembly factor BamB